MVLLFRYNNYQGSVWFSSANAVTGKSHAMSYAVESFFNLSSVNSDLTVRNLELEHEVSLLRQQLLDHKSRKSASDTSKTINNQEAILSELRLIKAKVVDNSVARPNNLITIDKGTADGVHADMGVASGNGIVGIVFLASSHYSIVIPVINIRSNISCAIEGRGYFGYLQWDGKRSDTAYLEDIPRHAYFKKGDRIVTSGYSSVFPSGILVGTVEQIYNSADGLSYRLKVKLSTNFSHLRDVCVIDDSSIKERLELMRLAQDSIKPINEKK